MLEYHCNVYEVVLAGGGLRNKSEAQSMQEYAMLISNRTLPSDRQDLSISNCAWDLHCAVSALLAVQVS